MRSAISAILIVACPLAAAFAGAATRQARITPDPDLGISEGLARDRAARVSNLRYDLAFTIPAGLLLLREIQRTGDIFFPKRWMDTTLSGHQSPAAAATVRTFLDRLPPDCPARLRRVILSSADDLFRASRSR